MSGETPQSKGGTARAANLTKHQRREIALRAAEARWAKVNDPTRKPEAETAGTLTIGDVDLSVYVLDDRRRLIAKRAMATVLHLKSAGGNAFMHTMTRPGVRSALSEELRHKLEHPVHFKALKGDLAHGYEAETLIEVCDALVQARNEGKLMPSQMFLARQAEIVIRSAAKVGIVALIDEATGYKDKVKDEYRQLFERFIRDEFRQWEKEFPDKFFEMIYRLYGLKRQKIDSSRHPQFFGKFIRKYVYHPLANSKGALLERLDEKNPHVYVGGGRRFKLFQFLSDEIGLPAFRQHLWQTVGILQVSSTKQGFERNFYRAFPEATPMGHQWDMLGGDLEMKEG